MKSVVSSVASKVHVLHGFSLHTLSFLSAVRPFLHTNLGIWIRSRTISVSSTCSTSFRSIL